MAKHKGVSIRNAYFAIEVPEFVVVPAELVRLRTEGKLESGALDFWCVLYHLNYRREPISYTVLVKYLQWGRGKIAKFIQQFKELGCLEVSTHRGQAFYKLVWRGSSITELPSSITELPSSITEPPSSITELPSSITELPSSITELPQFQNRTAVRSNGGGKIKSLKKEEDLLRDAAEPREASTTNPQPSAPAQPESSFIHTEKKEARSAPTSSVDVRTGDWREAGEHLRAFIAKMKQKDSHAPPIYKSPKRSGDTGLKAISEVKYALTPAHEQALAQFERRFGFVPLHETPLHWAYIMACLGGDTRHLERLKGEVEVKHALTPAHEQALAQFERRFGFVPLHETPLHWAYITACLSGDTRHLERLKGVEHAG